MENSAYVRDIYKKGVEEIRSELRSYWLNHSFILGHQWTYWDSTNAAVDNLANEGERIQATMNRTRANLRIIMANLLQRELSFENPPTAYDDASIRSARLGESLINDVARSHIWESLREELMFAVIKGGTAAISVDWDPVNKETVETVLPVGEFVVEPGARSVRKARYWVRRQSLPRDEVWSMFRDYFGDDPPKVDSVASLDPYMHRIVTDASGTSGEMVDRVNVFTYYERPNPLCPDGKILVEVGGQIVENIEKWPFPFNDRLNIVPATETSVEGRWYGATFMDDVRPVQVALNAAWSNLLEHLRDAGVARLMVPSSGVDLINAVSDIPGEILEYPDGVAPPAYLSPSQLTGWLREMPDMLGAIIDDIMGVHDVSRGMAPTNIESGLGLSILAEKDSSPVGRLIKESARVFTEVAQMVLMIIEKEVTSERETVVRDGLTPVRFKWTGDQIAGQHSVHVPLDAIQPRSRAAMQAFADKAMEMGLITTVEQYAMVADLPGQEDLIAAASPDVAKARRENAAFVLDEVMLPAAFDDHEIHIQVHNDFRKTQRYEQLEVDQQEVVDLHIQAHETIAAEEAATAMTDMAIGGPALAAAPNADGSQIDPALLQAPGVPGPPPPPMPEEEPMDPAAVGDMLMGNL